MPTDPRLGGVPLGLDPRDAQIAALWQRCADLQRQINDQRAAPTIQVVSGIGSITAREGAPIADRATNKLYVVLNGAPKGVTLT